ncbi:MAG: ATP synthase F1 subunit gamma [Thermoanaerobaculia bacterium]
MANRRVLVRRRTAARNIRKITRTMQLVATARFQTAFSRATATKPYSDKLAELVADLSRAAGEGADHPLMHTHDDVDRSALVVITSGRGFCGGYNANVLRTAIDHVDHAGRDVDVHMVGKKGVSYFRFAGRDMAEQTVAIGESPGFDQIEPIANGLIDRFSKGEIAAANVVYMRFHSTSRQQPEVLQLLPLAVETSPTEDSGRAATGRAATGRAATGRAATGKRGSAVDYEFSPEPRALLEDLLPASVRMRLFQCFTDAVVSEQVARMVAMKAATDAAGDMITTLTRQYNRARQTHITMELLDIIGGASQLAG